VPPPNTLAERGNLISKLAYRMGPIFLRSASASSAVWILHRKLTLMKTIANRPGSGPTGANPNEKSSTQSELLSVAQSS
jgi:hypothetical protein